MPGRDVDRALDGERQVGQIERHAATVAGAHLIEDNLDRLWFASPQIERARAALQAAGWLFYATSYCISDTDDWPIGQSGRSKRRPYGKDGLRAR